MTYEKDAATAKIEEGQTAFDQGVTDETVLDIRLPEKEEIAAEPKRRRARPERLRGPRERETSGRRSLVGDPSHQCKEGQLT